MYELSTLYESNTYPTREGNNLKSYIFKIK